MVEHGSPSSGSSYERTGIALSALSHYEDLLRIIYESYAGLFPNSASFWLELAEDEASHAQAVKDLQVIFAQTPFDFEIDRFDEGKFLQAVSEASNILGKVSTGLEEKEALEAAIVLEDTVIEQQLFAIIDSDPEELATLFRQLKDVYPIHVGRVRRRLDELS